MTKELRPNRNEARKAPSWEVWFHLHSPTLKKFARRWARRQFIYRHSGNSLPVLSTKQTAGIARDLRVTGKGWEVDFLGWGCRKRVWGLGHALQDEHRVFLSLQTACVQEVWRDKVLTFPLGVMSSLES